MSPEDYEINDHDMLKWIAEQFGAEQLGDQNAMIEHFARYVERLHLGFDRNGLQTGGNILVL